MKFKSESRSSFLITSGIYIGAVTYFIFWGAKLSSEILLQADAVFFASFFQDLFLGVYPMTGWRMPGIPSFFPDALIYFPLWFWFEDVVVVSIAYALVFNLICVLSFYRLFVLLGEGEDQSLPKLNLSLLVGAFLLLMMVYFEQYHPFMNPNHHASLLLYFIWLVSLGHQSINNSRTPVKSLLAFTFLGILGVVSNALVVLICLLPISLVSLFVFLKTNQRNILWLVGACIVSIGLGFELFHMVEKMTGLLFVDDQVKDSLAPYISLRGLWISSLHIGNALQSLFPGWTLAIFVGFMLVVISLSFSALRSIKVDSRVVSIRVVYFLVLQLMVLFSIGVVAISYAQMNWVPHRYAVLLCCLPALLLPALFRFSKKGLVLILFQMMLGCFVVFSIVSVDAKTVESKPWHSLSACLDEHQSEYNLQDGFSNYWLAKPISLLSKTGIRLNAVSEGMDPFYWMNNYYWFFRLNEKRVNNFILLWSMDESLVVRRFGLPAARFTCGDKEVYVYNRPTDSEFRNLHRASVKEVELWKFMTGR